MLRCKKCNTLNNIKILNLNFAKKKIEGQPATKMGQINQQYYCHSCNNTWFFDHKCMKLYAEYQKLKPETTLVAQIIKNGGAYNIQHIDTAKLMRRTEIARDLVDNYQHMLDIDAGKWYELFQDVLI